MKKYKHKNSGIIAEEYDTFYKTVGSDLPKWIIEGSNDWEEVIEDFTGVCFRYYSDITLYKIIELKGDMYTIVWKSNSEGTTYTKKDVKRNFEDKAWIRIFNEEYNAQFIVPKTYQILSFKWNGELTTLRDNGYYVYERNNPEGCPDGKGATLQHMLNEEMYPGCVIYSVKRLSDSVVFTIGDKIGADVFKSNTIEIFDIFKDNIYVVTSSGTTPLHLIYHSKTPLFTTEDNVDIFDGDAVYYVNSEYNLHYVNVYRVCGLHSNVKWFSTKEKAQDFISVNTPKYSKKQVFDALQSAGLANFNYDVLLYLGE